jgi:hypothetical protein
LRTLAIFTTVAALAFAGSAAAELSKTFGDYEVHYNALTTADLAPEVAKAYGIQRSRNRGMLTVSVLKKASPGIPQPVAAQIDAKATSLAAQITPITLREIKEQAAIYYIGEFPLAGQSLRFDIRVRPEGAPGPYQFGFERSFY